jgi:hypothetical protein
VSIHGHGWGGARLGAGGPKRHLHLHAIPARVLDRLVRYERAIGNETATAETIVERLISREADRRLRESEHVIPAHDTPGGTRRDG